MSDRSVDSAVHPRVFVMGLLAVIVLLGGIGLAVGSGEVTTSLSPDGAEADVDEEVTFDIVVEGIEDDIGAHTTTVEVADTNVAEIVDLEPAGDPLFEPDEPVADDRSTATIDIVYGDDTIEADADNEVVIATVTLKTNDPGTVEVSHTIEALGDGDGQNISISDDSDTVDLEVDSDGKQEPGPVVQSATVRDDGPDEIVIVFDEEVDTEGETSDASSLFEFNTDDDLENSDINVAEEEIRLSDGDVTVPLDSEITADDPSTITDALDYTGSVILGTADGNPVEDFENQDIINDVEEEPSPDPAEPTFDSLDIASGETDATITEGDDEPITVDVENVGGEAERFDVNLVIGEEVEETRGIDVDAGDTETLIFEGVTDELDAQDDVYTVTVQLADEGTDTLNGNLTVEEIVEDGIVHSERLASTTNTFVDDEQFHAEVLVAGPSTGDSLVLGGESDRTIEIRHPEMERSLEIVPGDGETLESESLRLQVYNGDGTIRNSPFVTTEDGENVDVDVSGDLNIFTDIDGPFTSFTLALLEDGEEVDTTDERLIGIGYEGSFEQTGTDGEIEITLPRDEDVNENWDAEFGLGATEEGGPLATSDVAHDDGDELFEVSVDVSDVEQGAYDASLTLSTDESDSVGINRVVSLSEFEAITVGDSEDISSETDDDIPGFGVVVALIALIAATLLASRQLRH